jgi:hypothetical protein
VEGKIKFARRGKQEHGEYWETYAPVIGWVPSDCPGDDGKWMEDQTSGLCAGISATDIKCPIHGNSVVFKFEGSRKTLSCIEESLWSETSEFEYFAERNDRSWIRAERSRHVPLLSKH